MISCVEDMSGEIAGRYPPEGLAGARYRFLGTGIEVKSNSPEASALADGIYRAFRYPEKAGGKAATMYLIEENDPGGKRFLAVDPGFKSFICSDPSLAVSFWGAQLMVNHLYPAGYLILHGLVLGREGKALIALGESRAGKTTLALKLRREGVIFFSDECAPVELESGRVLPFPRSFLLREDALALLPFRGEEAAAPVFDDHQEREPGDARPPRRHIFAPGRLYERIGSGPAAIGSLFLLSGFSDGPTETRPLEAARALEMMLHHSVNPGYMNPDAALDALVALLKKIPAFTVTLGHRDEEPEAVQEALWGALEAGRPYQPEHLEQVARRCREVLSDGLG